MTDASLQPHWLPDVQSYAVEQERQRHLDAVYSYGEFAVFVLMWRIQDFEAGNVGRCTTCFLPEVKTAEAFGQAKRHDCPNCFGTTFEGGIRARIIRPSLWDHDSTEQHEAPRGDTYQADARVQTTDDFNLNTDDYIFRRDGTRWQIRKTDWDLLRTGFGFPVQPQTLLGWNLTSVDLEDESSVAYLIPPTREEVTSILTVSHGVRFPPDFSAHEVINGPLNPGITVMREVTDEASTTDTADRQGVFARDGVEAEVGDDDEGTVHRLLVRSAGDVTGAGDAASRAVTEHRSAAEAAAAIDSGADVVVPIIDLGGLVIVGASVGQLNSADAKWFQVANPVYVTGVDTTWADTPDPANMTVRLGIATGIVANATLCRSPNWLSDGAGHQCYGDIASPSGTPRVNFLGTGFLLSPGTVYWFVSVCMTDIGDCNTHIAEGWLGSSQVLNGNVSIASQVLRKDNSTGAITDTSVFDQSGGGGEFGTEFRQFTLYGHP